MVEDKLLQDVIDKREIIEQECKRKLKYVQAALDHHVLFV